MSNRPDDISKDMAELDRFLDDLQGDDEEDEGSGLIDPSSVPFSTGEYASSTHFSRGSLHAASSRPGCSGAHRGMAVKGIPTLLGSSLRDGLVVPGNSVTVLLARELMAVALPAGWASYRSPEFNSHLRGAFVFWPWKDMAVPSDAEGSARRLRELHEIHVSGKTVEVACFGGHGRTGTVLSVLAALHQGWPPERAVENLRSCYCGRAVETAVQEKFVEDMVRRVRSIMKGGEQT